METKRLVTAAQYVRMSTEDQQYSIANQEAAIQTYAKSHGYVVTSTYADAGKSGVAIKHRQELRRLLHDVTSGQAPYKTILVYDVSRFGRFQDVDEAASVTYKRIVTAEVTICPTKWYWLSNHFSAAWAFKKAVRSGRRATMKNNRGC